MPPPTDHQLRQLAQLTMCRVLAETLRDELDELSGMSGLHGYFTSAAEHARSIALNLKAMEDATIRVLTKAATS